MSSPKIINRTPMAVVEVFRGAPLPLLISERIDGVPRSFETTLVLTASPPDAAAFSIAVGSGITLEAFESVASARAVIRFSEAQSLLVKIGSHTPFEITEGTSPNRSIFMAGMLLGRQAGTP